MNSGKDFEAQFKDSIPKTLEYYYVRLKDSANSFNPNQGCLRFTLNQPYDCQLYNYPYNFCFELKSKATKSLSIQKDKEKGKDIKRHQINGLIEADLHYGVTGGIIINFRDTNNTYFLWIRDFVRFENSCDKKSINEKDVIAFGGILVSQELKRIKYIYNIVELISNICKKELPVK